VVPAGDAEAQATRRWPASSGRDADYAHRQISQLSGGQQQRVFLARALAQEADLYFMDEPFAGVDAATERAIVEVLRELKERGEDGDRGAPRPADRPRVLR
jgi:ABC-type Mn2+/Zn2+ transport system ATPase subunit